MSDKTNDQIKQLLRDLTDPDDCWFDHHGGCQAHGYLSLQPGEKCPHAEAKELLALWVPVEQEGAADENSDEVASCPGCGKSTGLPARALVGNNQEWHYECYSRGTEQGQPSDARERAAHHMSEAKRHIAEARAALRASEGAR